MRETVGIAMLSTPTPNRGNDVSFSILVNGRKYGDMNMAAICILLIQYVVIRGTHQRGCWNIDRVDYKMF